VGNECAIFFGVIYYYHKNKNIFSSQGIGRGGHRVNSWNLPSLKEL